MNITKEAALTAETLTPEDLALINRLSKKTLTAEEVYTFTLRLCDNEVDRDHERFPRATLEELAPLFVGKSGLFDHEWSAKGQTARLYKTQVVSEPGLTKAGDPLCCLKGWAYMLRTEENAGLIAQIEGGIKKEVSVGCAVAASTCSICGKPMGACEHRKGKRYNGKLCFASLEGATDAYEWSFVAVPAQPRAGVMKALGPTLKDLARTAPAARAELERLEKDAALGRRYLEDLRTEVIRLTALREPRLPVDTIRSIARRLDEEELTSLKALLDRDQTRPGPQLSYTPDSKEPAGPDPAFLV
ncbi:MAG: hypothetical protein HFF04_03380 [Oscillospiraceae bacterium]|nr:hypothetical protein [Oscillospiraceae bacterium]